MGIPISDRIARRRDYCAASFACASAGLRCHEERPPTGEAQFATQLFEAYSDLLLRP